MTMDALFRVEPFQRLWIKSLPISALLTLAIEGTPFEKSLALEEISLILPARLGGIST